MSFESGLTFFIAIFIFGITPGPGVFAVLSRAIVSGAHASFPLALGMAISDIIYLVMACFGLAAIAENWSSLFTVIRFSGAAYLLYLGWKMWTSPVSSELSNEQVNVPHWFASFIQGVLISASNPKVILFYIAFLPTFMNLSSLQANDIVIASLLTLFALVASLMLIAFSASHARKALRSQRAMKRLNRIAGSIMGSAGIYLASRQ